MKLEVIVEYFDIEQEKMKEPGDILTVSEERGRILIAANVAKTVEQVEEPEQKEEAPAAPAKKPAKKRTAKK